MDPRWTRKKNGAKERKNNFVRDGEPSSQGRGGGGRTQRSGGGEEEEENPDLNLRPQKAINTVRCTRSTHTYAAYRITHGHTSAAPCGNGVSPPCAQLSDDRARIGREERVAVSSFAWHPCIVGPQRWRKTAGRVTGVYPLADDGPFRTVATDDPGRKGKAENSTWVKK